MKIVIGTHVWNQKDAVLDCLVSLTRMVRPDSQMVVVDNASTDGIFEAVRRRFPNVPIVTHPQNLGCAEGINTLIRHAIQEKADFLFVADAAGTAEPDALQKLVFELEKNQRLGAVSPFVEDAEKPGRPPFESGVCGRFCLYRMEAVKRVGFFDPYYFVHFEDRDWFLRLEQAGYSARCLFEARARFWPSRAAGFKPRELSYYRTRNGLYFLKKNKLPGAFLFFLRQGLSWPSFLGCLDFLRGKRGGRSFGKGDPQKSSLLEAGMESGFLTRLLRSIRFQIKRVRGESLFIRVYVNWNLGDELIASPAYRALKEKYPRSIIETRVHYPELLKGDPFVDEINPKEIRSEDLLIDLHREIRTEPRMECLERFAGVSSWSGPRVYLTEEEKCEVRRKWKIEKNSMAVCTESQWFSRRWEREKWIELVDYFMGRYSARVFVLGKEGGSLPRGIDLVGKTSLREAAALLSQCRLFVSSDSGPLHLALAVGTPAVGLYGPLNPHYLVAPRPSFIPLWSEVECRGCWSDARMKYRDHCPKVVPDCMTSISLGRVVEASEKLLSNDLQSLHFQSSSQ